MYDSEHVCTQNGRQHLIRRDRCRAWSSKAPESTNPPSLTSPSQPHCPPALSLAQLRRRFLTQATHLRRLVFSLLTSRSFPPLIPMATELSHTSAHSSIYIPFIWFSLPTHVLYGWMQSSIAELNMKIVKAGKELTSQSDAGQPLKLTYFLFSLGASRSKLDTRMLPFE